MAGETDRGTTVFVASNFDEFSQLRRAIQRSLADRCAAAFDLEVIDLNDGQARLHRSLDESRSHIDDADLVILLLGERYGGVPHGESKSYVHLEWEHAYATGTDLLPFRLEGVTHEPRMTELARNVHRVSTVGILASTDPDVALGTIADSVNDWLERIPYGADTDDLLADKIGIGRQIQFSRGGRWHDTRLGWFDSRVLGAPRPKHKAEAGSLTGRAQDEWNEACKAYAIRSYDMMVHHLDRAIDLQPLHAEARTWLARLLLTQATTPDELRAAASHAHVAAVQFNHDHRNAGRAGIAGVSLTRARALNGFSQLVKAKALRRLAIQTDLTVAGDDLDDTQFGALEAADEATKLLGWHAEPFIERCHNEVLAGKPLAAVESARQAFFRFPRSLHMLDDLLRDDPGDVVNHARQSLESEIQARIATLIDFGKATSAAIDATWTDVEAMTPSEHTGTSSEHTGFDPVDLDVIDRTELDHLTDLDRADKLAQVADIGPVQRAEVARSMATDNLRLLRTFELLVRRLTTGYTVAEEASGRAQNHRRNLFQFIKWEVPAVCLAALTIGSWMVSYRWAIFVLLAGLAAVGYHLFTVRTADELTATTAESRRISQWQKTVSARRSFLNLVNQFETNQMDWTFLRPRHRKGQDPIVWYLDRRVNAGRILSNAVLPYDRSDDETYGQEEAHRFFGIDPDRGGPVGLYGRPRGSEVNAFERWRAYRFDVPDDEVSAVLATAFKHREDEVDPDPPVLVA